MNEILKDKLKQIISLVLKILFWKSRIDSKKIVLVQGTNSDINVNFQFFFESSFLRNNYKIIVVNLHKKNKNVKTYLFYNPISIYHLLTAKYWFSDSGYMSFLPKKTEQKNILLWHGAGAFKKFGFSALKQKKIKCNKNKYRNLDLITVSSDKVIDIYKEAFGIKREKVKNLGTPRVDIFFKENEKLKVKEKFFNEYPELKNKKIIMYAPTFRDNDKDNFKLKLDIELLKKKLGKLGYVLILRLHPGIKISDLKVDNLFSYNFSKYLKVSDLLIVSDILISDYSSIIFDYSIMKKPILFYSYDVEEYIKDRGFYYNYYEFIPNKINYTTEEIINSIINKEWDLERIEEFARYFFNPFDGNSTERVLKEVGLWEEEK